MKTMRIVLIGVLTVLLPLSTYAGGTAEESSNGAGDTGIVELEYFSQKPEAIPAMEVLVAKFTEENPGIRINIVSTPEPRTVLLTRISTNDMPDILNSFPAEEFYKTRYSDGRLLDLTDQTFLSNVSEATREMASHDGRDFALPMSLSTYGIYYRTDIFAEQGLSAPTTYEELMAVCRTLESQGITPFTFANKDLGNIAQRLERLIGVINNDIDGEFRRIAAGSLDVADSPSLNGFAEMLLEITAFGPDDALGIDHQSSVADFVNGEAAMLVSGSWALGTMKTSNPDISTELIPFPNPTGDKTNVPINIDTSFSISADCSHPDEALAFLEFLSRPENAQIYCDMEGSPNMIKGVSYGVKPHQAISEYMTRGDIFLTAVNYWPTGLREEMRNPTQRLIMDGDVAAFLAAAGTAIDQYYN